MNRWNQISHRIGGQLFRRLAVGYKAGLDLRALWKRESESTLPTLARGAGRVYRAISQGDSLSEAMQKAGGYFSPLTIAIVHAGEQSGRLEIAFERISNNHESWRRFHSNLLGKLFWPVFELAIAIIVIGALILLMGWAMATANRGSLDWLGFGWSTTGYFRAYVAVVSLVLLAAAGFCVALRMGVFGDVPRQILLKIPLIGGILRSLALARFSWSLGASLGAGMDVPGAMSMTLDAAEYPPLNRARSRILQRLQEGESIQQALEESGGLPRDLLAIIANGEEVGELPESLDRMCTEYQERVESGLKALSTVGFLLTFVLVAALIIAAILFLFNKLIMETYQQYGV